MLSGACIVGLPNSNSAPSELYYFIRDNLTPRLKSKLGNRLSELRYTGDYISKRHFPGEAPINQTTLHYLTMPYGLSSDSVNWHTGFFDRNGYDDDKYFFLVNLLPESEDSVCIRLAPPIAGYYNYRFRNFEGQIDTTFFTGSYLVCSLNHPAGESYLYEVAPVVKYGGKLYHDETISSNTTLYDDMTVENGADLTVNAAYNCYGNIYIKGNGKIVTTSGGTIIFHNGKGIIAEAYPQLIGTSEHKLTLDFGSENSGSGVQLLQNSQFIMNIFSCVKAVDIQKDFISARFKKVVRECKLDDRYHFHSLRHTFASWLVQMGVPIYEVSKLLGHADIKTTQIYSHLRSNDLRDAVDSLD